MTRIQQISYDIPFYVPLRHQQSVKFYIFCVEWAKQLAQLHKEFWENWYTDVFNIPTANAFGLSVWSRILGLPFLLDQVPEDYPTFRFDNPENFDQGNFRPSGGGVSLTIPDYRVALQMWFFRCISDCTFWKVNNFYNFILKERFGEKAIVLVDSSKLPVPLPMVWTYVFNVEISAQLFTAITTYDLLVRPTGVKVQFEFSDRNIFRFDNPENFDQGNFQA